MQEPVQQILLFGGVGFVIIIGIIALVYDHKTNESPFYPHHFGKECNCEFCAKRPFKTAKKSISCVKYTAKRSFKKTKRSIKKAKEYTEDAIEWCFFHLLLVPGAAIERWFYPDEGK
ncbi:hypothetical protein FIE12Z_5173 [Fusarium flagelliforme]|uniref:Uncharacterized protein n=1 Tax=Fusarium flagelliforme TaxID=2675880 RepID=A0A395MS81_9HYPO|nr:hypothetical protein FIE12Z_5173 [Fusarium flagelliforme]